jgi:hypothetical protein
MIVHFDCASPVAFADFEYYEKVVKTIQNLGHSVANIWDSDLYTEMAQSIPDEEDLELLCKKTLEAIDKADAVILDVRGKGVFGLGYQAAHALQTNKPTLLLLHEGGDTGSFVGGLRHPLLQRRSINRGSTTISDFLQKASIK